VDHAEWFSAFVEPHRSQIRTFLQKYQAAADKLATDATAAGPGHTFHLRWPRVPTLTLPQTTLRVTDQLRRWIDGKELRGPHSEALGDSRFDGFAYPAAIPAIAVPININGTESHLREKDYYPQRAGLPFQVKVRPTFDLSSPHDSDSSPNEFCVIGPMT
jgi:hypothetical protein